MREIKFRVWDKKHKVLVKQGEGIGYCNFTIDMGGKITREILNLSFSDIDRNTTEKQDNYVVQQFTGLKDKNGKEIYEGDILTGNIILNNYQDNVICKVEYNNSRTCFDIIGRYENTSGKFKTYLWFLKENIEIIGNIFENPELLNENNN